MDRFPGRWSPGVLRRVVTLAAGSPYAALELARETAARAAGTAQRSTCPRRSPTRCAAGWTGSARRCWPWCRRPRWPRRRPGRCCARSAAGRPTGGWMRRWRRACWTPTPPDPVLRFSHPLLREAAEGMLTGPGRRRLHRAIGAALADPDEAAWHLARGADEPDETLAERAEQAAQHASARGAPARAAALAQAAAELTPDPDSLPAWRRRISWLERLDAAAEFEQVRRLGEKWAPHVPAVAARAAHRRARAMWRRQTSRRRARLLRRGIRKTWPGGTPPAPRRPAARCASTSASSLGRLDEARSRTAAAIAQARAAGNPVILRQTLAAAGHLAAAAGDPGAGDQLREAVRLPGFTDTPFPYEAPETVPGPLASVARRARPGAGPAAGGDRCRRAARLTRERRSHPESSRGGGVARGQLGRRGCATPPRCPLEPGDQLWPGRSTGLSRLARRGGPRQPRARPRAGRHRSRRRPKPSGLGVRGSVPVGARPSSSCRPMTRRRRCAGWSRSRTCCKTAGIGEPGAHPVHPRSDRGLGRHRPAGPRRRPAGLAAGRGAAPGPPVGADHQRPRRSRPAARRSATRPRPSAPSPRSSPRHASGGLPFELGRCLLVLGTAQRKARQRRDAAAIPRRGRRHLRRPGRPAVAGAGRGAAGPPRARPRQHASRPPSGASPTSWPPGTATPRSPRPCTSASRPSRPTSPASTANSASAAGSTWPAPSRLAARRSPRPPRPPATRAAVVLTARVFPDAVTPPGREAWSP